MQSSLAASPAVSGWRAELDLRFARTERRTILAERRHLGPLVVQRPFYPEGEVCHVYLLHPPGGVVSGDHLTIRVGCDPGAAALVTTPAAGKFYRSDGRDAHQTVRLRVADGASLEWLPQETIVFAGAQVDSRVRVDLAETGRFLGWELCCLGRPAADESFDRGHAVLGWGFHRGGAPLLLERLRVDPDALVARWGLGGHACFGTLFAFPATKVLAELIQRHVDDDPRVGITLIDGLLACRARDRRMEDLRKLFFDLWRLIRQEVIGRQPCPPRIWAT